MVDFRYFIVTIAAIFVALAVGVLLGAGPLKGELDTQLRANIEQLGQERDDLREERDEIQRIADYRDRFVDRLTPGLVADRLGGQRVVVVALPGSSDALSEEVSDSLRAAGAEVTGVVRVSESWADPKRRQELDDLAAELIDDRTRVPEDGSTYERAGALLARAVLTDQAAPGSEGGSAEPGAEPESGVTPTGAPAGPDETAAQIIGALDESDLASVDAEKDSAPATLAVVLAPEVPEAVATAAAGDGEKPDAALQREIEGVAAQSSAWLAMTRAMDDAGSGAIVAGEQSAAAEPGMIATLRSESNADSGSEGKKDMNTGISSVDVADLPSGRVAMVWALVEQRAGEAGHYGAGHFGDGEPVGVLPKL